MPEWLWINHMDVSKNIKGTTGVRYQKDQGIDTLHGVKTARDGTRMPTEG